MKKFKVCKLSYHPIGKLNIDPPLSYKDDTFDSMEKAQGCLEEKETSSGQYVIFEVEVSGINARVLRVEAGKICCLDSKGSIDIHVPYSN